MASPNHSRRSSIALVLDVARADLSRFDPLFGALGAAAITFVTLRTLQATEAGWLVAFTDLDNATRSGTRDPRVPRTPVAIQARLRDLAIDPDACFLARHAERSLVGYTMLDTAHSVDGKLLQSWTGVQPEYRRRGIGTALKVLTVHYARQHGYSEIVTAPAADNVASIALSRRVGFHLPAGLWRARG